MGGAGGAETIEIGDVRAVRDLMRSSDHDDRRVALSVLRSYQGRRATPEAMSAALVAAGVSFPWVPGMSADTSELFVRLTFAAPQLVHVSEFERAYMLSAERGRRTVLRALALRSDPAGLEAVLHLMGPDGPGDLLPAPSEGMLSPLLVVPGVERLATPLASAVTRRGWSEHAVEMITAMGRLGLLDPVRTEVLVAVLAPLVVELADTCDRRCSARVMGTASRSDDSFSDPSRVDRRRLVSLLPLLAELGGSRASGALWRTLACADPRASAAAAVALCSAGEGVAPERLALLCRDPLARSQLFEGLLGMGREFLLPQWALEQAEVAEAMLVSWLASATQLRSAPDEIEHRGVLHGGPGGERGAIHVFGFRVNAPHWAHERDWMLGVVGPFDPDALFTSTPGEEFVVGSLYESATSGDPTHEAHELMRSMRDTRDGPLR